MEKILFSKEGQEILDKAIAKGIETHVNGKIKKLREEMLESNELQMKKIDEMKDMLQVFNDSSAFFRVIINISKFLIPMATTWGIVWGFLKLLR